MPVRGWCALLRCGSPPPKSTRLMLHVPHPTHSLSHLHQQQQHCLRITQSHRVGLIRWFHAVVIGFGVPLQMNPKLRFGGCGIVHDEQTMCSRMATHMRHNIAALMA